MNITWLNERVARAASEVVSCERELQQARRELREAVDAMDLAIDMRPEPRRRKRSRKKSRKAARS